MIWQALFAQIPPTPTLVPTPHPQDIPIQMPEISLWAGAPNAITTWHSISSQPAMQLIEGLVLFIMIYFIMRRVIHFIQHFTTADESELTTTETDL